MTTLHKAARVPLSSSAAADIVDEWFGSGGMSIIDPGPRYWKILKQILGDSRILGALISDAHIAAIAIEYDATLCTADRDFGRFAGLRFMNPLPR